MQRDCCIKPAVRKRYSTAKAGIVAGLHVPGFNTIGDVEREPRPLLVLHLEPELEHRIDQIAYYESDG
ncbi:hypothetical protein [Rhizobium sp. P44RR-XXIV]|uniref:hypothetical protein n=1 Tax=Rhizobium sp. P44RR-XXIV TaxID=1921145 RepID=UPI0009849010|nr:hypothetical protein [Rhizobium sp. P44RR-XXIV]TIX90497.1 hypothetical protein BSK43_014590 [Rhizobium sp. P44RR-XXIV]